MVRMVDHVIYVRLCVFVVEAGLRNAIPAFFTLSGWSAETSIATARSSMIGNALGSVAQG